MDGELGTPRLGTPLGAQAQQNRVLGDRAGWGRHGSLAWHFLTLVPAPKAVRCGGHTHLLEALCSASVAP